MLFSYKYLKNYIDVKLPLAELILGLNVIGIESRVIDKDKESFESEVSANRNDCLSYFGLAREISAFSGAKITPPKVKIKSGKEKIEDLVRISIQDKVNCLRYSARVINNVKVSESPDWLKEFLALQGMRPVNNIVDVTNYVLLEYGQPLHAFDLARIKEHTIFVRPAKKGESITAINQNKYNLDASMLVIADKEKPVAIAGIMGGLESEVSSNTGSILLESAFFKPASVNKTSRKLNLKTDSSYHFERQVDWDTVETALDRAALLIQELSGGTIAGGIVDIKTIKSTPKVINLRIERLNSILGTDLKIKEVGIILKKLGIASKAGKNILKANIPSYRSGDLEREIDLIEEVSRIYGYDNIKETIPNSIFNVSDNEFEWRFERKVKEVLASRGMFEVVPYTFCRKDNITKFSFKEDDDRCRILEISNPLSGDQDILKSTVIPGLLEIAQRNINVKNNNLQIFELGKIFIPREKNELPVEKKVLGGLVTGFNQEKAWVEENHLVDFYDLKGILEDLFDGLNIKNYRFGASTDCIYHPNKAARIYIDNKEIGIIGELHPDIKEKFEFVNPVYLFEIDWQKFSESIPKGMKFASLPKFPNVSRDIALMISRDIEAEKILSLIKENGGSLIESMNIFDLYTGKQIPEGLKSLAISISYRHPERTLTDTEIESIQQIIKSALTDKLKATIR
ncbi:MAG: phenylalanine--tRNA ligase subunit beta [bacterium]|nr:phenylalanine--tRNA ligase subunit beta [bacterium]